MDKPKAAISVIFATTVFVSCVLIRYGSKMWNIAEEESESRKECSHHDEDVDEKIGGAEPLDWVGSLLDNSEGTSRNWRRIEFDYDYSALAGNEERSALLKLGIDLRLANGRAIAPNNGVNPVSGFLQPKALTALGVNSYIELWGASGRAAVAAQLVARKNPVAHNAADTLSAVVGHLSAAVRYRRLDRGDNLLATYRAALQRAVATAAKLLVRPQDVKIVPVCGSGGCSSATDDDIVLFLHITARCGSEQHRHVARRLASLDFSRAFLTAAAADAGSLGPLATATHAVVSILADHSPVDPLVVKAEIRLSNRSGPLRWGALCERLRPADRTRMEAHMWQLNALEECRAFIAAAATAAAAAAAGACGGISVSTSTSDSGAGICGGGRRRGFAGLE